jgi:hypothetical protein
VNYLLSKFSSGILVRGGEERGGPVTQNSLDFLGVHRVLEMGGGIDVFKSGEASLVRIDSEGDGNDDEDGLCVVASRTLIRSGGS